MSVISTTSEQILFAATALAAAQFLSWLVATRLETRGAALTQRVGRSLKVLSLALALFACLGGLLVAASEIGKLLTVKSLEFSFPGPVNVMEGVEASKTALLGRGVGIYSKAQDYPFLVTIYPPFFYVVSAGLSLLTHNALEANRLTSALSSIGLAFVLGAMFSRITRSKALASALVAVLFLSPPFAEWLVFGRPDMLVWFLAMSGLYCLIEPRFGCSATLSGILMGLALLTKQQALPMVISAAAYLTFAGNGRRCKEFSASLTGLCVLALVGLQWVSEGAFFNNVFEYPAVYGRSPEFNSFWLTVLQCKTYLLDNYQFLFTATICAMWFDLHNKSVNIFVIMFVVGCVFLVMLLGSWGAAGNYALPVIMAMYLSVASLLSGLELPHPIQASIIILIFCSTNLSTLNQPLFDYFDTEKKWHVEKDSYRAVAARIDYLLAKAEKPILADSDSGWLVINKSYLNDIFFFDGNHLSLYTRLFPGDFSQSSLVKDIENKRFSYILLNPNAPHPSQVTRAIASGYSQLITGPVASLYLVLR